MESSVGFFGQFKYVIKGITKPKYFNRLSNQSKPALISYTIIMALVSVIVYFGISFLFVGGDSGVLGKIKKVVDAAPEFTYADGRLDFDEISQVEIDGVNYIFDSTVNSSTKEYMDKVEIKIDWQHGVRACVFNGRAFTYVSGLRLINLIRPKMIYSKTFNTLGFLNIPTTFNKAGFKNVLATKFIFVYLIVAGLALIPFTIKAFITGVIFMFLGFGIAKIVKLPWTKPELYRLAIYITGFTTIIKSAFMAFPFIETFSVIYWILTVLIILGVGAYLFFAITGSTEDAGPSSTIVFNKPGQKKLDDIAPPDPFAKKSFGSEEYAKKTSFTTNQATSGGTVFTKSNGSPNPYTASVPTPPPTPKTEPSVVFTPKAEDAEPVRYQTAAAPTHTESASHTTFYTQSEAASHTEETPVYTETASTYEQPAETTYAEPETTYAEPAYTEPQETYTSTASEYSEPVINDASSFYDSNLTATEESEPAPAIIKSDLTTFGGIGAMSSSGKKSKPKYDRPITAPDAYNGLYYSGSDSEESYESNYGSGTLLDRGGLYGKTIGGESSANPFASVLGTAPAPSTSNNLYGDVFSASSSSSSSSGAGSSLYTHTTDHSEGAHSGDHVTFTTKSGQNPFGNDGFMLSNPPKPGYKRQVSTTKSGAKINRYSDDDFAAWEREMYAEEFSKPRGGFGNNIF